MPIVYFINLNNIFFYELVDEIRASYKSTLSIEIFIENFYELIFLILLTFLAHFIFINKFFVNNLLKIYPLILFLGYFFILITQHHYVIKSLKNLMEVVLDLNYGISIFLIFLLFILNLKFQMNPDKNIFVNYFIFISSIVFLAIIFRGFSKDFLGQAINKDTYDSVVRLIFFSQPYCLYLSLKSFEKLDN